MIKRARHPGESRDPSLNFEFFTRLSSEGWIPAFAGMTRWVGMTLFLFLFVSPSHALFGDGPGTTSSSFLEIPISARGTALAGAFTAIPGDVTNMDYNPAGLTGIDRKDINLSFIDYLEDSSLQSASIASPVYVRPPANKNPNKKSRVPEWFYMGFQYRQFKTDDERRSAVGAKLGDFDVNDRLFQLATALKFFNSLSIGGSAKFINSKIESESASNYAFDVGTLWEPMDNLFLGASVLNIGPETEFISEGDPLPLKIRGGAAYQFRRVLVSLDASAGRDDIVTTAGGVEFGINRFLLLRAGSFFDTTLEFTGGLGLRFDPSKRRQPKQKYVDPYKSLQRQYRPSRLAFGLDYAFQTRNELGISHTFTLKILY